MRTTIATQPVGIPPAAAIDWPRLIVVALAMFVQHAVMACWAPIMPVTLTDWGFTPEQIGHVFGLTAVATIVAPWIGGHLADRVMPAARLVLICDLLVAGLLWLCASERRFPVVLCYLIAQSLLYMPAFAVMNHIAMSSLRSAARNFGYVRMFGTAGWVAGSLLTSLWLSKPSWLPIAAHASLSDGLRLGALLALIGAVVCLFLPHVPPTIVSSSGRPVTSPGRRPPPRFGAVGALRLLRDRRIAVLLGASFLFSLCSPFVFPQGTMYLRSLGVSDASLPALQSLGQMVEVLAFAVTALLVHRFGYRRVFLIGMCFWVLRFAIWTFDAPFWLVVVSLGLHGFCYAWVYGLGMMFVDHCAEPDTRASAQAMHLVAILGLGTWPANWLAAKASEHFTRVGLDGVARVDYSMMFLWPLIATLITTIAFGFLFRDEGREPNQVREAQ